MENSDHNNLSAYSLQSPTSQPNNNPCVNFVRRLILALILMFITISAISTVLWLVINPKNPVFRVNSLSVSNFTLLNSKLTANYTIKLDIANPNHKINLLFHQLDVFVRYRKTSLSNTSIETFELGKKSRKMVCTELETESARLLDERTAKDMGGDLSKRVVSFDLKLIVLAEYMDGVLPSKQRSIKVLCRNLKVPISSARVTGRFMNNGSRENCLVMN